jgi:hypothetical protein
MLYPEDQAYIDATERAEKRKKNKRPEQMPRDIVVTHALQRVVKEIENEISRVDSGLTNLNQTHATLLKKRFETLSDQEIIELEYYYLSVKELKMLHNFFDHRHLRNTQRLERIAEGWEEEEIIEVSENSD